jgi:hypothetical protein
MSRTNLLRQKPKWQTALTDGAAAEGAVPLTESTTLVPVSSEPNLTLQVLGKATDDMRAVAGFQTMLANQDVERRTAQALRDATVPFDAETLAIVVSNLTRAKFYYAQAFDNLLEVGRALNVVQSHVGAGGYKALVTAGLITIAEATASKMRQIAAAIDGQKVPTDLVELMPRTLMGAYTIVSLPKEEIEPTMRALAARNMLPNAPQRAIVAEVKKLRTDRRTIIADIRRTLERKRKLREQLDSEIERLEATLREEMGAVLIQPDTTLQSE